MISLGGVSERCTRPDRLVSGLFSVLEQRWSCKADIHPAFRLQVEEELVDWFFVQACPTQRLQARV